MGSISSIFAYIFANKDTAIATINTLINMYKATTAPVQTTVPATPESGDVPAMPSITKKKSPEIEELQAFLNLAVKPQPPLAVDGWLGPKTEAAIHQGVEMLKPYLPMLAGG